MAKSISCKDVGMDCDFTARAETMNELMQAAAVHAKQAHRPDTIPPELLAYGESSRSRRITAVASTVQAKNLQMQLC
jgi:predicted small metal-binding protein